MGTSATALQVSSGRVRSREKKAADAARVTEGCSASACASMTTVGDDDDDVALGIAAIAPSTLDAASTAAAIDVTATCKHDDSDFQCDHDARTDGLRSM